ncbi:hypothetical protein TNCV_2826251 [Trichonephila clavipes]|nr:hypothetical protein TNCV_2826251 [Trichonephila clavipes]
MMLYAPCSGGLSCNLEIEGGKPHWFSGMRGRQTTLVFWNEIMPQKATVNAGHACSHPRVPRAHQAGLSRRSLAGVGLSESVRCHGPGLALLTNESVQQQVLRNVFN